MLFDAMYAATTPHPSNILDGITILEIRRIHRKTLQEVSKKYDSAGFFQKIVVGAFKAFP